MHDALNTIYINVCEIIATKHTNLCCKLKTNAVVFPTHSQYIFHCIVELGESIEFAVGEANRETLKTTR